MLPAHAKDELSVREIEPLTACFGVACFAHGDCARYAAVGHSQASPTTLGTCLNGKAYPLFVRIPESARDRAAPRGELPDRRESRSTTEATARHAQDKAA